LRRLKKTEWGEKSKGNSRTARSKEREDGSAMNVRKGTRGKTEKV